MGLSRNKGIRILNRDKTGTADHQKVEWLKSLDRSVGFRVWNLLTTKGLSFRSLYSKRNPNGGTDISILGAKLW